MFTVSLPKEFLSQKMEAVKSIQKSAYLTLICAFNNVREGCSLSYSTETFQAINNLLSNPTLHRSNVFSRFIKRMYWFECQRMFRMVDGPKTVLCSFFCFCMLKLKPSFQNQISTDCLRFSRNTLDKSVCDREIRFLFQAFNQETFFPSWRTFVI